MNRDIAIKSLYQVINNLQNHFTKAENQLLKSNKNAKDVEDYTNKKEQLIRKLKKDVVFSKKQIIKQVNSFSRLHNVPIESFRSFLNALESTITNDFIASCENKTIENQIDTYINKIEQLKNYLPEL